MNAHLLVDILTGVSKYIFQYHKFFHSVLYPSDIRVVYSSSIFHTVYLFRFLTQNF